MKMERETGFEPATLALARRCSTTELFPPIDAKEGRIVLSAEGPVKERVEYFYSTLSLHEMKPYRGNEVLNCYGNKK